jgi:ribonucleoside-diphosphate reductase alpha chain
MGLLHIELNNLLLQRDSEGFFQLDKDKEAVRIFMEEVRSKSVQFADTTAKVRYMIDKDYYEDVYQHYSQREVEEIYTIAHGYSFEFPSYMAASKFYTDYAMKSNDRTLYLEHYADRVAIVALHLAAGDMNAARMLTAAMMEQRVQPATPTFLNAGKSRRGEMVSCFLLEMDDSLNSINYVLGTCMQLSKIGGGVAVNVQAARSRRIDQGCRGCGERHYAGAQIDGGRVFLCRSDGPAQRVGCGVLQYFWLGYHGAAGQ